MARGFRVLAAVALAGLGAGDAGVVALAVSLEAVGFPTVATFLGEGAVSKAALLDSSLGHGDFLFELKCILAAEAGAVLTALPARGEALAVHLEAEGLLACASYFLLFGGVGSGGHAGDALSEGVVLRSGVAVLQGEVEVIEGELVRNGVDGVDHLQALIDIGELLHGGQVEERQLAWLMLHHGCNNFNIEPKKHKHCTALEHYRRRTANAAADRDLGAFYYSNTIVKY